MEVHAGDVAAGFFHHLQHFGIQAHNFRVLRHTLSFGQIHSQFGKHLGRGELAQIVQIAFVIGGLHADEIDFGAAHKGLGIKISRPRAGGALRVSCQGRADEAAACTRGEGRLVLRDAGAAHGSGIGHATR